MRTLPIMLNLAGRQAVIVGGGPVALHKVRALRQAGAAIRLVAPEIVEGADLAGIEVIRRPWQAEHLRGAVVVFACTDDRQCNARIVREARRLGALANAADQPEDCDFLVPAIVADGDVVIAVSTGGTAPALAVRLRDRLASAMADRIGQFAALLGTIRLELKSQVPDPARRRAILAELADEPTYRCFASGGEPAVRTRLEAILARE